MRDPAPGYGGDPWTVLLDPEGGEFCAFVRDELPAYRVYEVIVDAVDPESIARWWADVFGVPASERRRGLVVDRGRARHAVRVARLRPVPEPKTVKNRIHWDVYGDVDDFSRPGRRVLAELPRWTVLADPEGNEFCVFPV